MSDRHQVTFVVDTGAQILMLDLWLTPSVCPEGSHHVNVVEISHAIPY